MVSTRKKRQSNKGLLSQIDDFHQDAIICKGASGRQQNVVVNEGTVDQEFALNKTGSISAAKENSVNIQSLEKLFQWKD